MDISNLTDTQKEDLVKNYQTQVVLEQVKILIESITDKCFDKCVKKAGASLDNSETNCVAQCVDGYQRAHNLVTQAFVSEMEKKRGQFG